jgi:hypothetical protein
LEILKQLLLNSIYGIDIQEDAIRLSVFSLALALLDEVDLKPPVWQELKFPDLSKENIIVNDFFKHIGSNPVNDFDLVIGNPPFNLQPVNGKEPNRKKYFNTLEKEIGYKSEIKIPDENPALHFLVQAMKLLKPGAMLCLIQPSGPLLYQKDTTFKQALFSKYNLLQVLNFTKLADVLWGKKNVATAAIFLQNSDPDEQDVAHIVASRTFSNVTRLFLEFDHYDFHWISKDASRNSPFVWKSSLLGGGRIITLLDRFSEFSKLGEFLKLKELNESWSVAEGFIEKGDKADPCDYITGHPYLPSEYFSENKIVRDEIHPCKIQLFHRPKIKQIYSPPHLLIKENIGKELLSVYLSKEYLVFRANIIGINCPPDQINRLQNIAEYFKLNNDFLRFFIRVTSSQLSISKATVPLKEDFMNLPFSENLGDFKLSESEDLLVNDTLTYQLNNGGKLLSTEVTESQINKFSSTFSKTLNSVYQIENNAFRLFKVLDAGRYFALHFEYTNQEYEPAFETKTDLEEYIQQIIPIEKVKGKGFHIQRIMKMYGKDCVILAKPKQLRYWLPSIALRDADEAFADYIKARYQ